MKIATAAKRQQFINIFLTTDQVVLGLKVSKINILDNNFTTNFSKFLLKYAVNDNVTVGSVSGENRTTLLDTNIFCTIVTNFQYIQTICTTTRHSLVIFFNFWRTSFLFVVPLIPLCWTSGDVCPWFQSQSATPCLCTSSTVHNGFLRFTSGVTAADFLLDSMAAGPL